MTLRATKNDVVKVDLGSFQIAGSYRQRNKHGLGNARSM